MQNLFTNGQKTKLVDGSLTQQNQFGTAMNQIIMNNDQLNEKMENIERQNYNDFLMDKKFREMNLHNQINIEGGMDKYWVNDVKSDSTRNIMMNDINIRQQQNIPYNTYNAMPQIHPMLLDFNKQLQQETKVEQKEENMHDANEIYKDIIEVMERHGDERHQNSEFLKFIKRLSDGDIKLNEKNNDIDYIGNKMGEPEENMEDMWSRLHNEMNNINFEETKDPLFIKENPYIHETNAFDKAKEELKNGNAQEARLALEAEAQNNPDNSDAWLMLGKMHTENDRDDLAMQCFLKALEVDPFNTDAMLNLGISCTNEFDQFEAMIYINNWIKYNHEYSKYYDKNNILLNYELIKDEMMKDNDNEDYYQKALRIESLKNNFYNQILELLENIAKSHSDVNLWIAMGIGHFIPHNYERAIECFREAVRLNPNDHNAWNKLGAMLAHSKINEEAIATYKKALQIKPHYARCWANLGIAYFNMNDFRGATDCFTKALSICDIPHVWSYLNSVLVAMNRPELMECVYKKDLNTILKQLS